MIFAGGEQSMRILPVCVFALSVLPAFGQTAAPKRDANSGAPAPLPVPAVTLDFSDPKPIPGAPSSNAWATPLLCTSDGTIVVSIPNPTDWRMPSFYALDTKGSHVLSPSSAGGIYDMQYRGSYFASDSMYGIEVTGTRDDKQEMRIFRPDKPAQKFYTGKHHEYVLEFHRDGSYRKAIELPEQYTFWRIAPLPDDNFVAVAYDRANRIPRLLLLDSGGDVVRPIEIPQTMQDDPVLEQGQGSDPMKRAKAESSLSWWLFGQARGKVLLYKARAHASVLEIGSGGAAREVPVQAPDGYELSSVVPASDRWIMQFRRSGLSDERAVDARPDSGNFVYYEVDPNDGSLKRRIDIPSKDLAGVACEDDGVVRGFTISDGKWLEVTAELPR